jgi:hypothetical protein
VAVHAECQYEKESAIGGESDLFCSTLDIQRMRDPKEKFPRSGAPLLALIHFTAREWGASGRLFDPGIYYTTPVAFTKKWRGVGHAGQTRTTSNPTTPIQNFFFRSALYAIAEVPGSLGEAPGVGNQNGICGNCVVDRLGRFGVDERRPRRIAFAR